MKKILTAIVIGFLCSAMFSMFAPQAKADTTLRAWKDSSSLGLENDHLYLHGLDVTGNFYWFFDYLVFKDTGTVWYQPWGELAIIVYPNYLAYYLSSTYEIHAFTETDKAYLTYSITRDNLREDITYTIYAGQPYIYIAFSLTNIGSSVQSTYVGAQFTTWIAGDHANDYFYVPGYGQGQFTGIGNVNFPEATETWVSMWDQNKGEGCGMLSTKGFTPINMITEDFGIGEGFKFISPNFNLAPGQSSATYDCYLYFFKGTGYDAVKAFYDIHTGPDGIETVVTFDYLRYSQLSFTIQQNFWIVADNHLYWAQNVVCVFKVPFRSRALALMFGCFEIRDFSSGKPNLVARKYDLLGAKAAKNTIVVCSVVENGQLIMTNDFSSMIWQIPTATPANCYISTSEVLPGKSIEGGFKPEIVLVGTASVVIGNTPLIIGGVTFLSPTKGHTDTYLRMKSSETWVHGLNSVIDSPDKSTTLETSSGLDWTYSGGFDYNATSHDEGLKFTPDYTGGTVVPPTV